MFQSLVKNSTIVFNSIGYYLILGILTTLALSAFNLNSYCIVLLFALTLLMGNTTGSIKMAWKTSYFRACFALFLVYFLGVFYSADWKLGFQDVEQRLSLVIIPFIFCSQKLDFAVNWKRLMIPFSIILFIISFYCLVIAEIHFAKTNEAHYFFYHELVSPLHHHAVYFSVFIFITLVFLLEEKQGPEVFKYPFLYSLLVGYLILFMILLSSKLMLIVSALYAVYKILRQKRVRLKWYFYALTVFVGMAIVVLTNNPVKKRFLDISNFDLEKFTSHDLHAAYFNGVEFRLVQWKLVIEILNEKKRWLIGVSSADAQTVLNEKYKDYKFYQGDPTKGDKGYLDYNVHNQYLQCLLQSGIIGLIAFLYVCCSLIRLAASKKFPELTVCVALFILFCFTESVLQTQLGIVSFTLFPLLIYYGKNKARPEG